MKNKKVKFRDLGLTDFKEAWDYQTGLFNGIIKTKIRNRELPEDAQEPTENFLLVCQHPHVYTLGKTGHRDHLLIDQANLQKKEASYYEINRGGDITYHGPGQLVVYPILDLDNFFTDIHKYMRLLEESVIRTLESYGLIAGRIQGLTGVWINCEDEKNARKICAMGVKTSRWVSMHGLALNVAPDLDYFKNIIACGIADKGVTSMKRELTEVPDFLQVQQRLVANLAQLFEMEILTGS